jgi:hypothetical protein
MPAAPGAELSPQVGVDVRLVKHLERGLTVNLAEVHLHPRDLPAELSCHGEVLGLWQLSMTPLALPSSW